MDITAALLWNKSPRPALSMMIVNNETLEFYLPPQVYYFPHRYLKFRAETKKTIASFFNEIIKVHKVKPKVVIRLQYRILFHTNDIPYLIPAKESKFVSTTFKKYVRRTVNQLKDLHLEPQLRKRLSGKALLHFKRELRQMRLVNRKRGSGFEYHLWAVALHATPATYKNKLEQLKDKLSAREWQKDDRKFSFL